MRRACKRLLARLADERDSGNSSVVFTANDEKLQIRIGESSEILPAIVAEAGTESVPCLQFSSMAKMLRFYHKREVEITASDNQIKIERMVFRPPAQDAVHNEK
jgi:hypothetical protein